MCPYVSPVPWTDPESYEPYLGRWSRLVAHPFLSWLDVTPGSRWVETGCGTGALTGAILSDTDPASVLASDPSPQYLEHARSRFPTPPAFFSQQEAEHLDMPDDAADATVSGLVLNFVADPAATLTEARRVTRPGGLVGGYIWDYSGEMWAMRHFWDTAILLDPVARRLHEGRRFASWMPDELARRFRSAGLGRVAVEPIVIETPFRDFDDYWGPMLGQQGSAPAYIASLEASAVDALREAVRRNIPIEPDGSLRLTARAWAVKGVVPDDAG